MRRTALSGLLIMILIGASVSGATPAGADPALGGTASSFGITATVTEPALIPPTPLAEQSGFGDNEQTAIPIDAAPVAVNGTLIADARVHQAADLVTALDQPDSQQAVAGPYNAQAVGQIEGLEVLVDLVGDGVSLVSAELIRGEAVAKCVGNTVQYSASSEIVDLVIGGEDPLSGPLNGLITQISEALNASPLVDLVDIDVNVVEVTATGASVDALVISVLSAADAAAPPLQIRAGHAEVADVTCGAAAAPPQCSDTADNDGDGDIDADDPGCHTDGDPDDGDETFNPNDNDETDGECADTLDNDGDGPDDFDDPDCHTDGDAKNADTFDPNRRETTAGAAAPARGLPRTGLAIPTAAAAGLGMAALALLALRRRSTV